jgi:hypothetical protein
MNETTERAALRQLRSNRLRALLAGAGAISLSLFAIGCPEAADLENPPPNMTGGTGSTTAGTGPTTAGTGTGGTGTGGTGGTGVVCESACINKMFVTDLQPCKLCHGTDAHLGGLDLQSAGYTARLKNQPAQHLDGVSVPEAPLPASAMCGVGDKLIDVDNPGASWLWKKVSKDNGMCGTSMPQPPSTLTNDQMTCVKTYIECVAGKPITAGSGTGGSGTGGSGTGGTGTGGTGGSAGGSGGTGGT